MRLRPSSMLVHLSKTTMAAAFMSTSTANVQVTELPPNERANTAHHAKGRFINPWPSFRLNSGLDAFNMLRESIPNRPAIPNDLKARLPVRAPDWGANAPNSAIKATWLGHACFLVELPREQDATRGVRVLFDPVFSNRCSPSQIVGPARYTEAPCRIEDILEVDAIVISHNHYDHMDTHTLTSLYAGTHKPQVFAPLGNESYLRGLKGVPKDHVRTLDWWHASTLATPHGTVKLHCLPAQHFTSRSLTDRFKTLWASWALEGSGKKVWFGGDTGYRTVRNGEDEDKVPVCPAFSQIGDAFGEFDFAMIPIGAYLPRSFMSAIHCAPQDSVRIFQDIRAHKAVGMHWGTWVLTTENVLEPPELLKQEAAKKGLAPDDFTTCREIGETVIVE